MKRLVSLLLVICMLVPCLANAEQFGDSVIIDAGEDVFASAPEEIVQDFAEEDIELPEFDDNLMMLPNDITSIVGIVILAAMFVFERQRSAKLAA